MEGVVRKRFWQNKRVLITGYEGFLGSNLTRKLITSGAQIIGLDIVTGRKHTILKKNDLRRIKSIRGNVSNSSLVRDIFNRHRIQYIFHLAAEAIVNRSISDPHRTFTSNIRGTWSILEASRLSPFIKGIIVASSDKAYGIKSKLPYTEDASLSGTHPYDVSKSCADLIAYTYFKTYGVAVSVTRCGNIYGPGDFNFSRIVPDTIRTVLNNKKLLIRSDGCFTRDYIYIDDVVNAYIMLAEKQNKLKLQGEAFNFSNEKPVSVINIVKKICKLAGHKENYEILDEADNEIPHQYLSAKKARKILSWKPKFSLDDGLKATIDFYRKYLR